VITSTAGETGLGEDLPELVDAKPLRGIIGFGFQCDLSIPTYLSWLINWEEDEEAEASTSVIRTTGVCRTNATRSHVHRGRSKGASHLPAMLAGVCRRHAQRRSQVK
jgi:hypothetical protein